MFVCRGSTCRSPTAKAILRHLTQERKDRNEWKIESAGTHVFRTCRSPTAKAILRHLTQECKDRNEWKIESAGTHVFREGLQSNERGLQVLKKHGIASNHRARKVKEDDFRHFDVILAFDESNVRHLNETFKPNDGTKRAEVKLFGTYKLHSDM